MEATSIYGNMDWNDTWKTTEVQLAPEGGWSYQADVKIFLWFALCIGLVGFLANGLVFTALMKKSMRNRTSHVLIINQVFADLLCCFFIIISYGMKFLPLRSSWKNIASMDVLCILFLGDGLVLFALMASSINLALIAFERYAKIVHSVKHRNYFKRWMLHLAIAFAYAQSVMINCPIVWTSGIDDNGICYTLELWSDLSSQESYSLIILIWQYLFLLIIFIFCYGKIILKLKKKTKIEPLPSVGQSTENQRATASQGTSVNRNQMNVIKTMIIISLSYAVTMFPNGFGYVGYSFGYQFFQNLSVYYFEVGFMLLNLCLNPFFYVLSHDALRDEIFRFAKILLAFGMGGKTEVVNVRSSGA